MTRLFRLLRDKQAAGRLVHFTRGCLSIYSQQIFSNESAININAHTINKHKRQMVVSFCFSEGTYELATLGQLKENYRFFFLLCI